jgi:Protein of unknown function DUF262
MKTDIEEERTFDSAGTDDPVPPADVVAYNELRSCADLFRMYNSGKLEIQPDFQREVVWKIDEQSRFIDSLVKRLPIPSMCFSLDYKTQRWKVIDGLQRMSSIVKFLGEKKWEMAELTDIHEKLRRRSNVDLRTGDEEEKLIYTSVEDVTIPITVIRCDYTKPSNMNYLFTIFHRLNSGGVRLNNQEIRNCIYSGAFNEMLKNFDKSNKEWSRVKKRIWGSMDRFKSVEVLLRVLGFDEKLNNYDGNLAKFLNDYMHSQKNITVEVAGEIQDKLNRMMVIANRILQSFPPQKMTLTKMESMLVAIAGNVDKLYLLDNALLQNRTQALKNTIAFNDAVRYGLASVENVKPRLKAAVAALRE